MCLFNKNNVNECSKYKLNRINIYYKFLFKYFNNDEGSILKYTSTTFLPSILFIEQDDCIPLEFGKPSK